jgi:hypothetical protein
MKWGVRRAQKRAAKADKKWQKNIYSVKGAIDIHNNVADKMNNGGIAALNSKHPKAHLDRDTPETRAYLKAYEDMSIKYTAQAVREVHGTSPSGNLKARLENKNGDWQVTVTPTKVEHAESDTETPSIIIELKDNDQYIVEALSVKEGVVSQTALVQEFIEHYGTKGMKWGVRKARNENARRQAFESKQISELKKRKPSELTNKQLKAVNERLNMEQNFNRLNPSAVKRGTEAASAILATAGIGVAAYNMVTSPAGKAAIATAKKALKR